MNLETIGLLSPGAMGHAIGAVLHRHGLRVITSLQGRSSRTAALAAEAGILNAADDDTLVREADILLSILPPARAYALAERIAAALRRTRASLLFVDCNAISPRTVLAIEKIVNDAGAQFADAGIIGGPPGVDGAGPRIYASGPDAARFASLQAHGLDIQVISTQSGQASGLKMCYASLTKGLTALATEALVAARAQGLGDVLAAELATSLPTLLTMFKRQIPNMPPKAYRFVGEMEEIANTFADLGLTPLMLEGAAAMYRFVAATELGTEIPEERYKGQTLEEVVDILATNLRLRVVSPLAGDRAASPARGETTRVRFSDNLLEN